MRYLVFFCRQERLKAGRGGFIRGSLLFPEVSRDQGETEAAKGRDDVDAVPYKVPTQVPTYVPARKHCRDGRR